MKDGQTISSAELDFHFDKILNRSLNLTEMTAYSVATEKIDQVISDFH